MRSRFTTPRRKVRRRPAFHASTRPANVFVSSPQETAQGDHGVYDVDSESITLIGSVVLTRDKNVIRGARLVLNLVTGESRIEGAPAGGAQGRVRGRFVPGQKQSK